MGIEGSGKAGARTGPTWHSVSDLAECQAVPKLGPAPLARTQLGGASATARSSRALDAACAGEAIVQYDVRLGARLMSISRPGYPLYPPTPPTHR